MNTLLVEDNSSERSLCEEQIRSFGYDVTVCPNAEAALDAYQQTLYPLIIVDLGLPGIDGLEFCRRIRMLPQGDRSKILVMTGADDLKYLQTALDAGASDYLTKPFSMDMLRVRLTILTQQFRHRVQRKPHVSGTAIEQPSPTLHEMVETFEKHCILHTLEQHHWHKVHTAQVLGISRKTLYRKMKQFGLM
ncbi:MAG: response regulator [bacterium]|nr:response regulator [bacterium]